MKKTKNNKVKQLNKFCGICNLKIINPGDEYCTLIQYDRSGAHLKEASYHVNCFRERHIAHTKANSMVDRTMKILEKAESRLA